MQASRSILCLWLASTAASVSAAFSIGYDHGTRAAIDLERIDLERIDLGGGQAFALSFPSLVALVVAALLCVLALAGLLVSWRRNKQALSSLPHSAAILLVVPLCAIVSFAFNF
jgi:hypothetical protein